MKRTLSLVLALVLLLSLALTGCGGSNSATPTAAAQQTTAAADKTTAATTAAAPEGFGGATIDWYHNCSLNDGRQRAFETADALANETLGIELITHWVEPAEYYAKLQNLVATGQAPDVFYGNATVLVPFARDGVLLALDEYLDTYMPVSKSHVPENLWPAYTFSGSIYAIPPRKDLAENNSILYYKEKFEEANIEMPEWQRFGPDIYETLYEIRAWRDETYPEEYDEIISGTFDNFYRANCLEQYAGSCVVTLYDGMDFLEGYETGTQMFCAFDAPEYLDHIKGITQRVDDRISPRDRINYDKENVKRNSGDYYVWTSQGYIVAPTGIVDYEVALSKQKLSMMYSGYAQAATNMISADTENPEAAASFIEFMSTNKEWGTIVRFGIEGKNYVIDENGFVDCAAEGMENIKYWYGVMFGDICNCTLPNDCTADFAEQVDSLNKNNVASQNLGFSPDTTDVSAELAAVANVVSEYNNNQNLLSGLIDAAGLEALYAEFTQKLHANGVDTLVEEFQAQRDAWAENH